MNIKTEDKRRKFWLTRNLLQISPVSRLVYIQHLANKAT